MMKEIFKTILILSIFGSGITAFLLAVKPFTAKHFSAKWQYFIWLFAAACMIVPLWKVVPSAPAREIVAHLPTANEQAEPTGDTPMPAPQPTEQLPDAVLKTQKRFDLYTVSAYVWFAGAGIFVIAAIVNYIFFLRKINKNSVNIRTCAALEEVKSELKIRRKIRVHVTPDVNSPMLTGCVRPVIYLPDNLPPEISEKMIFRHELTHYHHMDLPVKWASLFVNALHWFNPFAYLLSSNISESCEIRCDMSVAECLDEDGKKAYIKTILDTAKRNGGK